MKYLCSGHTAKMILVLTKCVVIDRCSQRRHVMIQIYTALSFLLREMLPECIPQIYNTLKVFFKEIKLSLYGILLVKNKSLYDTVTDLH